MRTAPAATSIGLPDRDAYRMQPSRHGRLAAAGLEDAEDWLRPAPFDASIASRWSAMPKARLVITALFGTSVWPASSPEACAVRVDRLWDTTEGRMIPGPVKPHDRSHDRRIAQYFLVDPHLPDD